MKIELTAKQLGQLINARGDRSQSEIASVIGVSPQMVNQWERAKKRPTAERLQQWAHAVGLTATVTLSIVIGGKS